MHIHSLLDDNLVPAQPVLIPSRTCVVVAQVTAQPQTPFERLATMGAATNVVRSLQSNVRFQNPPECVACTQAGQG
jgi:hypothetical protein